MGSLSDGSAYLVHRDGKRELIWWDWHPQSRVIVLTMRTRPPWQGNLLDPGFEEWAATSHMAEVPFYRFGRCDDLGKWHFEYHEMPRYATPKECYATRHMTPEQMYEFLAKDAE